MYVHKSENTANKYNTIKMYLFIQNVFVLQVLNKILQFKNKELNDY